MLRVALSQSFVALLDTAGSSIALPMGLDWRVLAFTMGLCLITCVLFGLTPEENELVETRLALVSLLRRLRAEQNLTQKAAAERVRSDQANISKAERGDPTISLDWLIRTAYLLGASRQEVGRALCG